MGKRVRSLVIMAALAAGSGPAWADDSYGATIGKKAGSGFTNIALSWIEIPKNVVNTTNETNLFVGLSGGVVKGIIHTAGRILAGSFDFLSFPWPTKPVTNPEFVWENFNVETRYNPVFRPQEK